MARTLSHDDRVEKRHFYRNLQYGLLLGTLGAMVPPVVLPLEEDFQTRVIRHKDENVLLYSLGCLYIGFVSVFVLSEAKDKRNDWEMIELLRELNQYYRRESANNL